MVMFRVSVAEDAAKKGEQASQLVRLSHDMGEAPSATEEADLAPDA